MKKMILFVFLLSASFVAVQAQSDCASKKASSAAVSVNTEAADLAAANDASIDRRECEKSGSVSYFKKNACENSGKVSFSQVNYDNAAAQWVNVAPSDVAAEKAACASKASAGGKACCSSKGKASAQATSSSDEKAACASKASADGKACCSSKKGKGASAEAQPQKSSLTGDAKKVNN